MHDRRFGLYVHWPFCQAKCPYCDFNSHVSSDVNQSDWQNAYRSEIIRVAKELPGRTLGSIFFGGGTPSLMSPETVGRVIDAARMVWPVSNDLEITLEANPTSVEASRFESYASAGVNRVSIGVQSLRDDALQSLGRLHSVDEAVSAVKLAKSNFERVSFDIIYARQNQSLCEWRDELTEAIELASDHLSLYQLSVEPGTAFGSRFEQGKLRGLPSEDVSADMFELTQNLTKEAGLLAYETSNHSTTGHEARHNLLYWRSHDWAGIGPGAHGRYWKNGRRIATETHLAPRQWLSSALAGSGENKSFELTDEDVLQERILMGLRLAEGIDISSIETLDNKINYLIKDGLLWLANGNVGTTSKGRPLLNSILKELLA